MIIRLITFILLFSLSCHAEILSERGSYLKLIHTGQFEKAESKLSQLIKKEMPKGDFTRSSEASWLLLDRATLRFIRGDIPNAIEDFALAIEALDFYGQNLPTDKIKQTLLQDECSAYQAADYEQVLARVYFALALLHRGDRGNAFALLRSAEEFQLEQRALYRKLPYAQQFELPDNPLASYLFAAMLENKGDLSNANIIYNKLNQAEAENDGKATILVLCHNGNSPYKISETVPASVASAIALEFFLSTQRIDPAWSTLTGIPVPALKRWPLSDPQPTYASLNECRQPLLPFCNIHQLAKDELEQKKPVIVSRGVARLLMRRTAVGYMQKQNEWLGLFADLGMLIANSNTRADTRSWTLLPAFIDMTRFDVEPGTHTINIEIFTGGLSKQLSYPLELKPNDLCIINIFNIHPGVTKVLIPRKYQGDI